MNYLSTMVSSWRDQELLFLKPNKKLSWTSYITAIKVLKKTCLQARDAVYWEWINADIENMIKNCSICQENFPAQPKETLQPHDIPSRALEVVGTYLFNCKNHEYLIIADYYCEFPIIQKMNGLTTSNMVISTMKQIFSEHGIPSRVVSDNGPQYSSEAFIEFAHQ